MGCFTVGYYNQVKDYLHPHLHDFVNYYKNGNAFDLALFHGCNKKSRNGTRKLIKYDQDYQCIVPTDKPYWRKTENKYKHGIINGKRIYWTRYMTWTRFIHLFKNKGNFVYNYKLKKFEHMSRTPMQYDYEHLQKVKKLELKHVLQ